MWRVLATLTVLATCAEWQRLCAQSAIAWNGELRAQSLLMGCVSCSSMPACGMSHQQSVFPVTITTDRTLYSSRRQPTVGV